MNGEPPVADADPTATRTEVVVEQPDAPLEFAVPEGKVLLDQREAEILRRQGENYKGAGKLIEEARSAGFTVPEDFAAFKAFKEDLDKAGLDFGAVLERIKAPAQPPAVPTPVNAPEQNGEVISKSEIGRMVKEGVASHLVMAEHQTAQKQSSRLLQETIEGLSKGTDDDGKSAVNAIVRELTDRALRESFYPEDHPLGDKQFRPLDAAAIESIKKKALSLVGKIKGLKLAGVDGSAVTATASETRPGYTQTASGTPNPGRSDQRRSLEEVTASAVLKARARMSG